VRDDRAVSEEWIVTEALDALFERNVIRQQARLGYIIKCGRGLWKVWAPSQGAAEQEARYYFVQYLRDGEYEGS
jgi:hypothetical protein